MRSKQPKISSSKYVVVSPVVDVHIPYVERHLDEPFAVLDWLKILEHQPVSYDLGKNGFTLTWDGQRLDRAKGVWFRKPFEVLPERLKLQPKKALYAAKSLTQFNNLLLTYFGDAFWVSDYWAIRRASNKTLQLEVAQRLGFALPDTIITSSPAAARYFVDNTKGDVIVKPIDVQLYKIEDKEHIFLAQKVDKKTIRYDGLHLSPAIFQQAVDFDVDVRVTVVGKQTFAAAVTGSALANSSSNIRDWRLVHHEGYMVVTPFELPKHIADLCVAHVSELGLAFGAIDLVLDKNGQFWFLENNPNGQWLFVEQATKQPIGKAIANLLMKGKA